ncbi:hypothetical protein J3Q64DRAFT_1737535 [Phycomyces blakesleeanus]|uniref:HORMA domain-containing protein n=1 Tax=Phycomyces blakesleeanus TaxID=4837 RepID=A0ABR3B2J3_PHYBL
MNEATPFRAITVKASIKATGWSPEFLGPLQVLVAKVHTIVTNTFALMRYTFLTKLSRNPLFDLDIYITQDIFTDVSLLLFEHSTAFYITEMTR